MSSNWINSAVKHPGALHQDLGVPQGQSIPQGTLQQAAQAPGKLGERARFALNMHQNSHPNAPKAPSIPHPSAWFNMKDKKETY